MNAAELVALGAFPSFAAGWFLRDLYDVIHRGKLMVARTRKVRPFQTLFAWFSHGNRLTALVVITATIALAALGYTYSADQQSENRSDNIVACVARYVDVLSKANLPRTAASVKASDARRDWDRGHSDKEPELTKSELKARYLRLYANYEKVRAGNPLPEFSLTFCREHR